MSDKNNWLILQDLEPKFASNIKFVCIFGENSDEVLFVTKDDFVFGFGSNRNGCLGLGNDSTLEPKVVEELCHKEIIDISYGWNYVIVLTKSGSCYSMGRNDCGQLGIGTTAETNRPKFINGLKYEQIIAISCGYKHSLVLSSLGDIYAFGNNDFGQLGIASNTNQLTPLRMNGFVLEKVVAISCSSIHSLALTESGHVFSWGYNENGNLGIGNFDNKNSPQRVVLNDAIIIRKIVCGLGHNLMLSTDGDIYSFGLNNFGQLANQSTFNENIPHRIDFSKHKFIDIASEFMSNMSVAKSEKGNCFLWGLCNSEAIIDPKETTIKSIHDIFAIYSKRRITYKPMSLGQKQNVNKFQELNGRDFCDFKFKIDNKYIFVNKTILKNKCKYFETFFSENNANEIQITEYSYSVYFSFLKYIYTNFLEIRAVEALVLYHLANSYSEEVLRHKCFEIIKNFISIENCCTFYSFAVYYKLQDLEDFCFEFASNGLNKICKTIAFIQMDEISIRKFITRIADNMLFK
jgi:RCC1 and BTB domain-containing protein